MTTTAKAKAMTCPACGFVITDEQETELTCNFKIQHVVCPVQYPQGGFKKFGTNPKSPSIKQ